MLLHLRWRSTGSGRDVSPPFTLPPSGSDVSPLPGSHIKRPLACWGKLQANESPVIFPPVSLWKLSNPLMSESANT